MKIKSIFIFIAIMLLILFSVYGTVSVTLGTPANDSWVEDKTVDINFTPIADANHTLVEWCAVYSNKTGTWGLSANYTFLPNGTEHIRGIGFSDSDSVGYLWGVLCYNNNSQVWSTENRTLGVDANFPTITLDAPTPNQYLTSNATSIKYTPTDASNLDICQLYTNFSGTWAKNASNGSVTSGNQDTVSIATDGVTEGTWLWNVVCNQTSDHPQWAEDTNRTFTIDSTAPSAISFLSTNGTVSDDTTPLIRWNETTEVNFRRYIVRVSNDSGMSNIVQREDITTRTTNSTTLRALATNDEYFIRVTAEDWAGNTRNTSTVLTYTIDSTTPVATIISPTSGSYEDSANVNFTFTVIADNPSSCELYLSNNTAEGIAINDTLSTVTNGTTLNITAKGLTDGNYTYNIECNNTFGVAANVSATDIPFTVDTLDPTDPTILSTFQRANSTNIRPVVLWTTSTEINFDKYVVSAYNLSDLMAQINITTRTTNSTAIDLTTGSSYNFSVTAYDLAGNTNTSKNLSESPYYIDSVCGILNVGWNLCGAVWTASKNLSVIGAETSATMVSVWNKSNHVWATCNYAVSVNGTNCNLSTGINNDDTHAVWIYVNKSTAWNRTWVATTQSANITLSNATVGWNLEAGFFRNGRTFGALGRNFEQRNVTQFSLIYNNGTTASYVNKGLYANSTRYNGTVLDYGRAMWIYYNATGTSTWDVGSW